MNNKCYKVKFSTCNYKPEPVIVYANNLDCAVILAKAKRIEAGLDYTLHSVLEYYKAEI